MSKHNLQKTIMQIVVESKKNGLLEVTNSQITEQVKLLFPDMKEASRKVAYALYMLKRKEMKWNEPKIVRTEKGWTIDDDFDVWRNKDDEKNTPDNKMS